jgi:starvation-inducible outer membrane lipoprotein
LFNIDFLYLTGKYILKRKSFLVNLFLFILSGCIRIPKNFKSPDEDDDVADERKRIYTDRNNASNDVLRMVDLVKV